VLCYLCYTAQTGKAVKQVFTGDITMKYGRRKLQLTVNNALKNG